MPYWEMVQYAIIVLNKAVFGGGWEATSIPALKRRIQEQARQISWYDLSRFGHRGRDPRRGARSRIESRCLSLLHFAMARLEHKRDRGLINRPLRPLLSLTAIKASFTPGGREPRIADLTALAEKLNDV